MYAPKIGGLYKNIEHQRYFLITSFENPSNTEKIKVEYKQPGKGQIFERKGLDEVSDFLDSIEPVQNISSELEEIASMEKGINNQLSALQTKKTFLQQYAQSQETRGGVTLGEALKHVSNMPKNSKKGSHTHPIVT